jgi:FHS family L-fucose permease-like MFS transporter
VNDAPRKEWRRGFGFALVLTISLYALWGMAHNLNDILITEFKKAFALNDLQASLVQSCFYFAYLIMPLPVAMFMQRFGYKRGIVTGLCLYGAGALLFWPAAETMTYGAFLGALFVIACGLTFLETAGTGIIVVLGAPEQAEWRINLAQAFNPLGAITGVLIGRQFIFSNDGSADVARASTDATYRIAQAHAVQIPYLVIGLVVLIVGVLVAATPFPGAATDRQPGQPLRGIRHLTRSRIFLWGVFAQFFYVGTQIGLWSFFIRYAQFASPGMPERRAAAFLMAALVAFLIGRFASLFLLRRYSSAQIGAAFATCAALLTIVAVVFPGPFGIVALVGVSLFMSVMFPAIFAIGLHGNAAHSKPASALMIMAITGGAVLTAVMGWISDHTTIALAYCVPLTGFVVVFVYCAAAVRSGRTGAAIAPGH